MQNLEGRVALVTGASRGLGKGIAIELAACGAEVIVNYHSSPQQAEEVVQSIIAAGGHATKFQADVSLPQSVEQMFEWIKQTYGRLDILINNAGTSQSKDIFDITLEDWDWIIRTNLTSGFLCSKCAMEMMRAQNYGRIVFISSMVAHQGALYGHVHYAATKGGQMSMVKTLARTGAPLGITVNTIAPGIIETELLAATHGDEGIARLSATVPLGLGKLEDVGNAVSFMCSERSGYLTGITIDVNGGMYIR